VFILVDDLAGKRTVDATEHSAATLTNAAIDFIERATANNEPFFLNLSSDADTRRN
jgi:hypothetical protein